MYRYVYEKNINYSHDDALLYLGKHITYGQLFENINHMAEAFWKIGVRKGDFVFFLSITTPELIYSIYALNRIGAVVNMLEPRNNVERVQGFLSGTKRKFVVILEPFWNKFGNMLMQENIEKIVLFSPVSSASCSFRIAYSFKRPSFPQNELGKVLKWNEFIGPKYDCDGEIDFYDEPSEKAIIVYTSGTTGIPKGAMLSDSAWNNVAEMSMLAGIGNGVRQDKFLLIMPPFIAYGILGIHAALAMGKQIVIIPQFKPELFHEYVLKHKPNHILGVPTHWENLARCGKIKDLSFLKTAIAGGDKMSVETEEKLNAFFEQTGCTVKMKKGYGMTELCSAAVFSMNECNRKGSVGVPFIGNNVKVTDEYGNELRTGEKGELCVSGPTLLTGYYGNDLETRNIFSEDSNGTKWVKTGDIAYIDEDGFVYIVDRKKRMIIRPDGHNVFPRIIENVITSHPIVFRCVVVGKKDKNVTNGKWPVAFVVKDDEYNSDEESLRKALNDLMHERLPERDKAEEIYFIDKIPLTQVGKEDYQLLERMAENF